MKILPYTIELLEPVLVTSLDGDPNSGVSFDFLPGAALRGAIIGRYVAREKGQNQAYELDAADKTVQRLFFNGRTRYLNGYLRRLTMVPDQLRGLPLPRSWFIEKRTDGPVYDFAGDAHPQKLDQPKAFPTRFGVVETGEIRKLEPQHRISVHTARNRRFGRARPGTSDKKYKEYTGAIYRYDALATGQIFIAYILCRDGDEKTLAPLLEGLAMLGGSRSAGYGQVRLAALDSIDAAAWDEVNYHLPLEKNKQGSGLEDENDDEDVEFPAGRVIITLLSDAVLRDKSGQHSVNPTAVCNALDLTLEKSLAFINRRPDGSFNRKWGLPTTQMPVFSMGSVFVCTAPGAAGREALLAKQAAGIGERRAEGFGRFAIDWYHGAELDLADPEDVVKPAPVPLPAGSAARAAAERLAERLMANNIDRAITAEAAHLGTRQPGLQKSQIYRLQQQLETSLQDPQLDPQKDRERINNYLESLQKRAVTRKQFARTRINNQTIADWITTLLEAGDAPDTGQLFGRYAVARNVGDVAAPQMDQELRYRTNLRLINAVLSRIAKLAKDE